MAEVLSRRSAIKAGIATSTLLAIPVTCAAQESGDDPRRSYTVEKILETVLKEEKKQTHCDPNDTAPSPQAYNNRDGIYILNGYFGIAAYKFQNQLHVDDLGFEHVDAIEGRDLFGRPQVHIGAVYVGPSGRTRFFFSQTSLGILNGERIYPLYMSLNGNYFFRVLTPTGTKLLV